MKRTLIVVSLLILALVLASGVQAWYPGWGSRMGPGPGWGIPSWGWTNVPGANLTPEQLSKWSELRSKWFAEMLPLRNQLLSKRWELQSLLLQPNADPQAISSKQQEIIALEAQLREKGLSNWLAFRQTLTPEQLSLWTAGWGAGCRGWWTCPYGLGPGMGLGRGMGRGMGPGRGLGRGWNW